VLNEAALAQNTMTGMIGLRARAGNSFSGALEYGAIAGDNSAFIQTIRATLRVAF